VTAPSLRCALVAVVALVAAFHATALVADVPRAPGRPARIGYLASLSEAGGAGLRDAFRAGLRDLGYVEGDSVVLEYRWANGDYTRLAALARELTQLDLDLIVSAGGPSTARALKAATSTIPVVFVTGSAVAAGIVPGLARPGGNLTGLELVAEELDGKRLEVLTTLRPHARRIAVLWNPGTPEGQLQRPQLERAAESLGIALRFVGARDPGDLAPALATVARERADAMLVAADPMLVSEAQRIVRWAASARVPTMYTARQMVEAGGLISYGPDFAAVYRRAAIYVDKILKGAKPGDLPVQQPTTFELVINAGTARTLGLTIPASLRLRADAVIP
jgi:ABC-type uncharacterized transport system substrate-binding protein